MTEKENIRNKDTEQLNAYFESIGEKKFRTKQLQDWLWVKHAVRFEEMSNFSKSLKERLAQDFEIPALKIESQLKSADGTIKSGFLTPDNYMVEGVLIPSEDRTTACISSQIGCNVGCKFCATGTIRRKRNLNFDEIYDEVMFINKQSEETFGKKLSNIVFMGMGEPLLNASNMLRAIEKITAEDAFAMSPRRITVSTSGIAKGIKKLGDKQVKFRLALSLHAPNDEKRSSIMPINDTNNIASLTEALSYFYKKTENRITLEYILLRKFNDSLEDAAQLATLFRKMPADRINLIQFNEVPGLRFEKSDPDTAERFKNSLEKHGINVRLRISKGEDIAAACGQLAAENEDKTTDF